MVDSEDKVLTLFQQRVFIGTQIAAEKHRKSLGSDCNVPEYLPSGLCTGALLNCDLIISYFTLHTSWRVSLSGAQRFLQHRQDQKILRYHNCERK
jgi:hypothetical protein